MDSLSIKFAVGFVGRAIGTSANPNLKTSLGRTSRLALTGAGKQVYDEYQVAIPVSGTLTLDLMTGLTNPLGESISGSVPFSKVQGVWIVHDPTSLSSGITAFGGGVTEFQGIKAAGDKDTLAPRRWTAFGTSEDDVGMDVDGSHNLISIVNLSALYVADVNIFIVGTAGVVGNSMPFTPIDWPDRTDYRRRVVRVVRDRGEMSGMGTCRM